MKIFTSPTFIFTVLESGFGYLASDRSLTPSIAENFPKLAICIDHLVGTYHRVWMHPKLVNHFHWKYRLRIKHRKWVPTATTILVPTQASTDGGHGHRRTAGGEGPHKNEIKEAHGKKSGGLNRPVSGFVDWPRRHCRS